MNTNKLRRGILAFLALSTSLQAQSEEPVYELKDFIVSAGPGLRSIADYAPPVDVVTADELSRHSGGTLGSILDWQPGVSATSFASGASRPILRGFDGPRVRILQSGLEALDASDTSPDHGVAVEPLLVERIEILRGPSTLLYGGSAIGGAVNVIDKTQPRHLPANNGIEGGLEARYDTVSNGKTYIGHALVGQDNWAISVTGLQRDAESYKIPADAVEEEGERKELENSYLETDLYSIGGSWFFNEENRIGASYSRYESGYGVPGHGHHEEDGGANPDEEEEQVAIDLERDRLDLELELTDPAAWIEALRVRFGYTDYTHTEAVNGTPEMVFERSGWELRGEAAHTPWGMIDEGVIGIQLSDTDFEAISKGDEEAFTPPSQTKTQALFLSQHMHGSELHYEFGGRIERADISAEGGNNDYEEVALSLAAAAIWEIDEEQSLRFQLQRAQRHPTSTELYADGEHHATRQYQIGDPTLEMETAYGADLTYALEKSQWHAEVSAFYTYFEDYIFSADQGIETDEELHVYQYTAVDAQFYGVEAQFDYSLNKTEQSELILSLMGDWVRATNEDSDGDLPRIPPMRIGSRLHLIQQDWDAGLELRYAFEQKDTGPEETGTGDYLQLNADFSRHFELANGKAWTLFLRGENLLDETIRNHTSYLKDEAPLPGRNLTIGAKLLF